MYICVPMCISSVAYVSCTIILFFFFFKQKTAYEMRISDWSSDVCSSDLVLVHAFPDADIPVVQLSINAQKPPDYHLELGARLAKLRERGVLVLGSGNVVHNLRAIDWHSPDAGTDWARRFDEHAHQVMIEGPDDAVSLVAPLDFAISSPTPGPF